MDLREKVEKIFAESPEVGFWLVTGDLDSKIEVLTELRPSPQFMKKIRDAIGQAPDLEFSPLRVPPYESPSLH